MTKYVVKTVRTEVNARLVDAENEDVARWAEELERQIQTTEKTTITLFNDGIITDKDTTEVVIKSTSE